MPGRLLRAPRECTLLAALRARTGGQAGSTS
jgi:hypothetical protein